MQKISNFYGSKEDLVDLIQNYEKQMPDHFLLRRKKTGEGLPTNSRRVQQFCDEGIIPRAKSKEGQDSFRGRYFDETHLIAYLAAIRLRKSGHPVTNLASLIAGKSYDELETIAFNKTGSVPRLSVEGSIAKQQVSERLRKMGRKEGRALRSSLTRYALTPDVLVTVNTKAFKKLTIEDVDALPEAFKDAIAADLKSL